MECKKGIYIYVLTAYFNVWCILLKNVSIQQHTCIDQFVGKQNLVDKYLGISEAKPLRVEYEN